MQSRVATQRWAVRAAATFAAVVLALAACGGSGPPGALDNATSGKCGDGGTCAAGLHCNPSLGCVACIANSDCPTTAPVCSGAGACVQCEVSSQCSGTTPVCSPAAHVCRAACTADGGTGTRCAGATPICDASSGACVGCVTATDCPTTRHVCDATQTCVQCATDSDCSGTTPHCSGGSCVQCVENSQCSGTTPVCGGNGQCRAGCTSNSQCTAATAPVCDTASSACVRCLASSDCSGTTPFCQVVAGITRLNQCVACLPAMGDAGVQGCAQGQRCAGGACL